jgi:hypothetical protein
LPNLPDLFQQGREFEFDEGHERVYGGQPCVSCGWPVAAPLFKIGQKPEDQVRVDLFNTELGRFLFGGFACEGEEEPEGVGVRVDGMRA